MDTYRPAWTTTAISDDEETLAILPPLERFPSRRNKGPSLVVDSPEEQSQTENNSALSRIKRFFSFSPTSSLKVPASRQEDEVQSRERGNSGVLTSRNGSSVPVSRPDCSLNSHMALPANEERHDQGRLQASVPSLRRHSSAISVRSLSSSAAPSHAEGESFHGANATLHEDEIETSHHEYAASLSDDECNTSRPRFTNPFGNDESIRIMSKAIPGVVPILPALPNLPSAFCKKRKASSLRNVVLSSEIIPRRDPGENPAGDHTRPKSEVIDTDEIHDYLGTTCAEVRHPRCAVSDIDLQDLRRRRGSDVLQDEAIRRRRAMDHPRADDQNIAEVEETNQFSTGLAVDIVPSTGTDPSPWASIKKETSLDLRVHTLRRSSQQLRRDLSFGNLSNEMLPQSPIELCQRQINYKYGSQDAKSQRQSELPSYSAATSEEPMGNFTNTAVNTPFPVNETIREVEPDSDEHAGSDADDEREFELDDPFTEEDADVNGSDSDRRTDFSGDKRIDCDEERSKGKGKGPDLSVNF